MAAREAGFDVGDVGCVKSVEAVNYGVDLRFDGCDFRFVVGFGRSGSLPRLPDFCVARDCLVVCFSAVFFLVYSDVFIGACSWVV